MLKKIFEKLQDLILNRFRVWIPTWMISFENKALQLKTSMKMNLKNQTFTIAIDAFNKLMNCEIVLNFLNIFLRWGAELIALLSVGKDEPFDYGEYPIFGDPKNNGSLVPSKKKIGTVNAAESKSSGLRTTVYLKSTHYVPPEDGRKARFTQFMDDGYYFDNNKDIQLVCILKDLNRLNDPINRNVKNEIRFHLAPGFIEGLLTKNKKSYQVQVQLEFFETLPEDWEGGFKTINPSNF